MAAYRLDNQSPGCVGKLGTVLFLTAAIYLSTNHPILRESEVFSAKVKALRA